jgi:hypothetical protein
MTADDVETARLSAVIDRRYSHISVRAAHKTGKNFFVRV